MIEIEEYQLLDLLHWSRRYCDGRSTYAAHTFNKIYKDIYSYRPDLLDLNDKPDKTLMNGGAYWPYAQDGMYDPETERFDAR